MDVGGVAPCLLASATAKAGKDLIASYSNSTRIQKAEEDAQKVQHTMLNTPHRKSAPALLVEFNARVNLSPSGRRRPPSGRYPGKREKTPVRVPFGGAQTARSTRELASSFSLPVFP